MTPPWTRRKSRENILPAGISKTPTLAALIDLWDSRKLHDFLEREAVNPSWLYAGFKTVPASLKKSPVRARLLQELRRNRTLLEAFLGAADSPWCDWLEIIGSFAELWLLDHWRWLLRSPHGLLIAAAMAGDFRAPIIARGHRVVAALGYPWRLKERTALDDDRRPLAWTLLAQRIAGPPDSGPQTATGSGRLAALERELEQARESGSRLREKLKDLESRLAATEREAKEQIKELRRELADAKAQSSRQEESQEDVIRATLADYRAKLFGADGIYDALRERLANHQGGDLPAAAERVLEAQARLDRKFGTVRRLREESDALQAAMARLDEAAANSIRLLPELADMRQRIQARLAEIAAVLPSPSQDSESLPAKLAEAIRSAAPDAAGLAELAAVGQFLGGSAGGRLLDDGHRQRLAEALAQRRSWIEKLAKERLLAEAVDSVKPGTLSAAPERPKEIWDMPFELARLAEPPTLVVDGYNLIKRIPALASLETRIGQAAARDRVRDACQAFAGRFALIRLVYDGGNAVGTRETRDGVEVVFARRRGEDQHADDDIVEWLALRAPGHAAPIWLASDDHGLRLRAARNCDGFLAVADLAAFLALDN